MMAIMADIIASVEPQQTVISRSGSTETPCVRENFSAMASRNFFAPQVMAYWLMSAAMACCAADLISAGAGKSGKPCERFTAPCFSARRVISRITDSVKRSAFAERRELAFARGAATALFGVAGFMLRSVEPAINVGVARNHFDVVACLRKWDRVYELGRLAIGLAGGPRRHAILTRIVRCQRPFDAAELFLQLREIERAEPNVVFGIEEPQIG